MSSIHNLLSVLSDGRPHAMVDLCACSGLSPKACQQALTECRSAGLEVVEDAGVVRWIEPHPLLSRSMLASAAPGHPLDLMFSVDSTNLRLEEAFTHGKLYLAEHQSAGRGRLGRRWVSPACQNLYLSLGWRFEQRSPALAGLSLAAGVAACRALQPLVPGRLGIKWPNDLYLQGRKVGGILVETVAGADGGLSVVAGIGINVLMREPEESPDQPWTSLSHHQPDIDRNEVGCRVIGAWLPLFRAAPDAIGTLIDDHWRTLDVSWRQPVTVYCGKDRHTGIGAGIDEQFNFVLDQGQRRRHFNAADIKLRLGRWNRL